MKQTAKIAWATAALAVLATLVCGQSSAMAALILNDDFSTSTLNAVAPAAPTTTSANYQVLSTKNATTSSIGAGSLKLVMENTSSGLNEIEALFTASPVALTQTGDFVEATAVFVPTGLNLLGNSTINIGLFNSAGAGPVPGTSLNNNQLDDDPGTFATGNAGNWLGYVGRIGRVGGASSQIFTRPAQVGETSNEAQDALFNNAAGGAFDSPTGTTVQGGGAGATLTNGTEYTLKMRVTYDAGTGFNTVSYSLASGMGTIDSLSGTTTVATTLATSFDAMALGYRGTDSAGPFTMDIRSLTVETNVQIVPEPLALSSMGLAIGMVIAGCRRRR